MTDIIKLKTTLTITTVMLAVFAVILTIITILWISEHFKRREAEMKAFAERMTRTADKNKRNMNFYFTYGSDPQYPFNGGYTIVVADSKKRAAAVFRLYHPDVHEGILNCAFVYDQESMERTGMLEDGNGGAYCHEYIECTRLERLKKKLN